MQVSDCAEHPADIQVDVWSEVTCAECPEQSYNNAVPVVVCASDNDDDSLSSASSGGSGSGGDVAPQTTPAPTLTSAPAAAGGDGGVAQTPAPTAAAPVVDGEREGFRTCMGGIVTGWGVGGKQY